MAKLYALIALLLLSLSVMAQTERGADGGIMSQNEDYVRASFVVAEPGQSIYSALGHASLRLECPEHGLDYIFSYEGENVDDNVARFFMGRLQMAVMAIPTQEFLSQYHEEGRGVRQYPLQLPLHVKQRLWQQMDERVQQQPVPYDYMNRGCAVSVLQWIEAACDADSLQYAAWPDFVQEQSRKEIGGDSISNQWQHTILYTIAGGEAEDTQMDPSLKAVVPSLLVRLLHDAQAYGRPLLAPGEQILPSRQQVEQSWFTPTMLGLILLAMSLLNLRLRQGWLAIACMALPMALGLFVCYLVLLSELPCTQWNWLLLPLNPLPLLLWRWRRQWALPYAALCLVWIVAMLIIPQQLVDPLHLLLAATMAVSVLTFSRR
ncbi:MAG: DUF4105 domain-containing protein [Bacteroidaceae bacterium]|nr:DUF4105 domain-containing protein [Bacteroidaceae bacterium]